MSLSDRLLDPTYIPTAPKRDEISYSFTRAVKCPVSFTDDPFEYAENYIKYTLKPAQKLILKDLFSTDSNGDPIFNQAVFVAGMRCLGIGTEILMYDWTIRKIEDIHIGELVMGPDLEPRKVLETDYGRAHLYKIEQSHGVDYIVNENHILSLKRNNFVDGKTLPKVVNIPIKEYLKKTHKFRSQYKGYKYNPNKRLSTIKVSSIGIGTYAGIAIDKDHLFCLADGTVTHNSGKSILGAIVGSFLLHKLLSLDDPGKSLGQVPGQKFVAEFIATSENQSKNTAYAAFENIILNTDWWKKYIRYLKEREETEGKETLFQRQIKKIAFPEKNLEAVSLHSNSASLAGLTAFFVCFDEMSRFYVSDGDLQQKSEKTSAQAVYYTASRAAKTLGKFSKIVTITSPMYETDFGMQLLYMADTIRCGKSTCTVIEALRSRYPKRVKDIIGYHYSTWEANPKTEDDEFGYVEEDFAIEKEKNYAAFLRDFKAIPPSAISPFFELPERIDSSVVANKEEIVLFTDKHITESVGLEERYYIGKDIQILNSNKIYKYFICCDQGAVKDSFAVAMGHAEEVKIDLSKDPTTKGEATKHKIIIDFVEAWVPSKEERITVSFKNVEDVIRSLSKVFYIDKVVYDQWHSTESIERLFAAGVSSKRLGATIEMYETMKLLLYSGMIVLPNNPVLLNELRQLNSIKGKKIDHPADGCFTGDTLIKLPGGKSISIKELADKGKENKFKVIAYDKNGRTVITDAYNAHKTKSVNKIISVQLRNSEVVRCTPEHLFMLVDESYVAAKDLQSGDVLRSDFGPYPLRVLNKYVINLDKPIDVFDITVPKYNNFLLNAGIFVHNSKDLADAVVRVIWCVYLDSIHDAVHSNMMLPSGQSFPTIRSIATQADLYRRDLISGAQGHYGIFSSGQGEGVFGKNSYTVETNVRSNVLSKG